MPRTYDSDVPLSRYLIKQSMHIDPSPMSISEINDAIYKFAFVLPIQASTTTHGTAIKLTALPSGMKHCLMFTKQKRFRLNLPHKVS